MASTLLVIDSRIKNYRFFTNQLSPVYVLILDPSRDGLQQIGECLDGTMDRFDSIQIISHGTPASLRLGSTEMSSDNIDAYEHELSIIGSAMHEDRDLLLYGCNVGSGIEGREFVATLAAKTGADVAASDDVTGLAVLGGDWELEVQDGIIDATLAISNAALDTYGYMLGYSEDYLLAKMSLVAYYDNPENPSESDPLKWNTAKQAWDELYEDGWRITASTPYKHGDFAVIVFIKEQSIVLAYRGSDAQGDWDGANLAIAGLDFDNWDVQFDEALTFIKELIAQYQDNPDVSILVTGHSLGGSLAQLASKLFNLDGAAFDPGGAENLLESSAYHTWITGGMVQPGYPLNQGPGDNFINYLISGSLVSHWPKADHVGAVIELYNGSGSQDVLHDIGGIIELLRIKAGESGTDFIGTYGNDGISANGLDNVIWGYAGDDVITCYAGNDIIYGGKGNDTISGGVGNDMIDGGEGQDLVLFSGFIAEYQVSFDPFTGLFTVNDLVVDRDGVDCVSSAERFAFIDGIESSSGLVEPLDTMPMIRNGIGVMPEYYTGPATAAGGASIHFQYIGDGMNEVLIGTHYNDFINVAGGMDAVDAGAGNDVIDGGTGSNFLMGGMGTDIFFSDGRGGQTTWSTIVDWQTGEQLSVWGWQPGVSRIVQWVQAGAAGYEGLTMHADLNGDNVIDTSVTFTGIVSQSQLPTPLQFDGVLWFT